MERSRSTGFELTDEEGLPGWGGPLFVVEGGAMLGVRLKEKDGDIR